MSFKRFTILFALIALFYRGDRPNECFAEEHNIVDDEEVPVTVQPRFYLVRDRIVELCTLLEEDGKQELIFKIASRLNVVDKTCSGCKQFFLQLYTTCKPRKIKKIAKGASPIPTPVPQRAPRASVLDAVSRLSIALYEDEERRALGGEVLERFSRELAEPSVEVTAAEREYLDTFRSFLRAPFEEFLEAEKKKRMNKPISPSGNKEELNTLFD